MRQSLVLLVLIAFGSANAGTMYVSTNYDIYSIERPVGSPEYFSEVNGNAMVYGDGYLFASDAGRTWKIDSVGNYSELAITDGDGLAYGNGTLFAADSSAGEIYTLDPSTGAYTLLTSSIPNVEALVYGDGYLYASDNVNIFKVDTSSGAHNFFSNVNGHALAYGDGFLYGSDGGNIFKIDAAGNHTLLSIVDGYGLVYGDGVLYGTDSGTYAIDVETGEHTLVTNYWGTGLAYASSSVVPIPAAAWLFGSGLSLLSLMRRRSA